MSEREQTEDICRVFGIPSQDLHDTSGHNEDTAIVQRRFHILQMIRKPYHDVPDEEIEQTVDQVIRDIRNGK